MHCKLLILAIFCCFVLYGSAERISREKKQTLPASESLAEESSTHSRSKRTLFLKKKVLGAGLLGFSLGLAKGYKFGYLKSPEVHHLYLAPSPPVRYVEYVEKPIFLKKIVEKPLFKPVHLEHIEDWSQPDSPPYGTW